eukprot:CAMPEP_0185721758 /NCGR_PEP_ID=MMETSP1164-20130828/50775_1 /TAXON_ID=1104430 /ORGANISM="Chrysoreinhardia sp, Strain CCMP2950" /LENGTH=297 /DNA_ID=CAMNT_0028389419 /DNA_START=56 /DNA_END=949 /DNA_ORIENTATION=+
MTSKVAKLQRASLRNPARVEVSKKFGTPSQLLQQYLFIPAKHKECYLVDAVRRCVSAGQSVLVFSATCSGATKTTLMLRNLGLAHAACLHGQMTQPKRLAALNKFKASASEGGVLIATDVAARGLDVPAVDVVLNYDIPAHGKEYVHRVGRTARAGRRGTAIAFVTQYDVEIYQRLEHLIGHKLPACPVDEARVLQAYDDVNEASRRAAIQLRDLQEKQVLGGKRRRAVGQDATDDDDDEEAALEDQRQADIFGKQGGSRGSKSAFGGRHHHRGNKGGGSQTSSKFKKRRSSFKGGR